MKTLQKFTNEEASKLFKGKFIISNNDGTIWIADSAEIISWYKSEYENEAKDWPVLECKFPGVKGFGHKKVSFVNLQKTEFTREQFSNSFGSASASDCVNLQSRNIQNILSA